MTPTSVSSPIDFSEANRISFSDSSIDKNVPDILYHYCSTSTFHAIITSGVIRMSSLTMSNDSMEGKWAVEVANKVCADVISPAFVAGVIQDIKLIPTVMNCVGLCLSEKRDLLSQWRGYANNGYGVCIGISRESITEICDRKEKDRNDVRLQKVIYRNDLQNSMIKSEIKSLRKWLENPKAYATGLSILSNVRDIEAHDAEIECKRAVMARSMAILSLFRYLFRFKSDAFFEEAEWRLLRFVVAEDYNGYKFRPTDSKIIPFDAIEYGKCRTPFIREVILGPKHETPIPVMRGFLKEYGFPDARIEKSSATYR